MKKLVVFGLVLLAIALVLDFGARAYAESQASNVLKTSLHLSRKPQVSLNGFPFLVHLATERFDSVTIDGRDVRVSGLRIRSVHIELDEVRFSLSSLVTGGHGEIETKSGSGSAELTADALSDAFRDRGVPVDLQFADGHVEVTSNLVGGSITADLALRGRQLVLTSPSAAQPFTVTLPRLIAGISYTKADIQDDVVVMDFDVAGRTIKL